MSEASFLAADLESIFISEELHANKAKRISAELRRLSAVEQELEALKRAISEAEPVAWRWTNINTEADGVYLEDPTLLGIRLDHTDYEWTPLYTLKGVKSAG